MAREANELSVLSPGGVTLAQLRGMRDERLPVRLHEGALKEVEAAHRAVARILERGTVAYGINTGKRPTTEQILNLFSLAERDALVSGQRAVQVFNPIIQRPSEVGLP